MYGECRMHVCCHMRTCYPGAHCCMFLSLDTHGATTRPTCLRGQTALFTLWPCNYDNIKQIGQKTQNNQGTASPIYPSIYCSTVCWHVNARLAVQIFFPKHYVPRDSKREGQTVEETRWKDFSSINKKAIVKSSRLNFWPLEENYLIRK